MQISIFEPSKSQEISNFFYEVFTHSESEAEGILIGNLVSELIATTEKHDLIGFVATLDEKCVGSIFFSRLVLPNDKIAFILSPVAIATSSQGKGLGQKLINFGTEHLKSLNVDFVFTYGDPNFYSKVGFLHINEDIVKAPFNLSHPEGWLARSLNNSPMEIMKGSPQCVSALNDQKYW